MTMNQCIELFGYGCFGAAGLLIVGSLTFLVWRADHPKKDKKPPRTGAGMLE
jgi:hypothetical protein